MGEPHGDRFFDVRLIPEFDGAAGEPVTERFEKLELVCRLHGVEDMACVVPLRLTGGAFAVCMELPDQDKQSAVKVKEALLSAFTMDLFAAYDEFTMGKLLVGEAPDVFLAELRNGISEKGPPCAFIAGLPESVRQLLRAGTRLEDLSLSQVLARAGAVLTQERPVDMGGTCLAAKQIGPTVNASERRCFACVELNHIAKDCRTPRRNSDQNAR
ncbi:zinc knuckle [Trichuris suis]|nr:zinc knuckle [Trichuris suis]